MNPKTLQAEAVAARLEKARKAALALAGARK